MEKRRYTQEYVVPDLKYGGYRNAAVMAFFVPLLN